MTELSQRIEVTQHGLAEAGNQREQVRSVKRCGGPHGGMIGRQLRAEVEAFFPIGFAGRQLATHWKVPAPGTASTGHRDLHFLRLALGEELAAQLFQLPAQRLINAVIDDVEESRFPAGGADLRRGLSAFCGATHEWSHVDHWNLRELAEIHSADDALTLGESQGARVHERNGIADVNQPSADDFRIDGQLVVEASHDVTQYVVIHS